MLVLNRKKGEKIVINDNVVLTVVAIGPGRVKLGIECPKEMPVHREEVWKKIKDKDDNG